jgi:B9 domain-containing protein 1
MLQLPDCDNAYLKYQIVAGEDWQPLDGLEDGITQASRSSQGKHFIGLMGKFISMGHKTLEDRVSITDRL